jgi:hypothetical protein
MTLAPFFVALYKGSGIARELCLSCHQQALLLRLQASSTIRCATSGGNLNLMPQLTASIPAVFEMRIHSMNKEH